MKRRIVLLITAILLLTCCLTSASATQAQLRYVTDMADLLTQEQVDALEVRAAQISERYNFGVYIITVNDFRQYANASRISSAAIEIYDSYQLGWGEDHAGTMLMLSMNERDYNLDFNSSRADEAFTGAGRDRLEERVVSYLRNNDYYGAFQRYLSACDEYLLAAENGQPVGKGEHSSEDSEREGALFIAVAVGAVAALITGLILSAPMHTAGLKHDANAYAVAGSLKLHRRSDMFLHRSVTRVPRQTQSSSGGSSHHYSSGSHSGRSGKF